MISFLICGILVYILIVLYDEQEFILSIADHVEKKLVSDNHDKTGHTSELKAFEKSILHNYQTIDGPIPKEGHRHD